jgi:signal peptidase II
MRVWGPRSRFGLATALAVLVIDRVNKHWLVDQYDLARRGAVELTGFLDLVMVWNRGVSYGLLQQDGDAGRYALVGLALALSAVLVVWLARTASAFVALGLGLVIGGALSNPIDRLVWGAVADFYRLHAWGYSWYVFNLADAAIVAGAAILLYSSFDVGHKSAEKRR